MMNRDKYSKFIKQLQVNRNTTIFESLPSDTTSNKSCVGVTTE